MKKTKKKISKIFIFFLKFLKVKEGLEWMGIVNKSLKKMS